MATTSSPRTLRPGFARVLLWLLFLLHSCWACVTIPALGPHSVECASASECQVTCAGGYIGANLELSGTLQCQGGQWVTPGESTPFHCIDIFRGASNEQGEKCNSYLPDVLEFQDLVEEATGAEELPDIDCSIVQNLGCCLLEAIDSVGADEMERVMASLAASLACPSAKDIAQRCSRPTVCTQLPGMLGVAVACTGNYEGDYCHVACDGELSQAQVFTCTDSGQWQGQWPVCPGITANVSECEALPNTGAAQWACGPRNPCHGSCSGTAPFAAVSAPHTSSPTGGVVGPLLGVSYAGAATRVCGVDDSSASWFGSDPQCSPLPSPVCSAPDVPEGAYYTCDSPQQASSGSMYKESTKCVYSCSPGSIGVEFNPPGGGLSFDVPVVGKFSLQAQYFGEVELTCQGNGEWSGKQVECIDPLEDAYYEPGVTCRSHLLSVAPQVASLLDVNAVTGGDIPCEEVSLLGCCFATIINKMLPKSTVDTLSFLGGFACGSQLPTIPCATPTCSDLSKKPSVGSFSTCLGDSGSESNTLEIDATCTQACLPGYEAATVTLPDGSEDPAPGDIIQGTCESSGLWSQRLNCKAKSCPLLYVSESVSVSCEPGTLAQQLLSQGSTANGEGFLDGDVCELTCGDNAGLVGPNGSPLGTDGMYTVSCNSNGWNGVANVSCTGTTCPISNLPPNALAECTTPQGQTVVLPNKAAWQFDASGIGASVDLTGPSSLALPIGTTCALQCATGFVPAKWTGEGNGQFAEFSTSCEAGGSWTESNLPACIAEVCAASGSGNTESICPPGSFPLAVPSCSSSVDTEGGSSSYTGVGGKGLFVAESDKTSLARYSGSHITCAKIPLTNPCGSPGCGSLAPHPSHFYPVFTAWSPWAWSTTIVVFGNTAHSFRTQAITATSTACGPLGAIFDKYLLVSVASAAESSMLQVIEQVSDFHVPATVLQVELEAIAVADLPSVVEYMELGEQARAAIEKPCRVVLSTPTDGFELDLLSSAFLPAPADMAMLPLPSVELGLIPPQAGTVPTHPIPHNNFTTPLDIQLWRGETLELEWEFRDATGALTPFFCVQVTNGSATLTLRPASSALGPIELVPSSSAHPLRAECGTASFPALLITGPWPDLEAAAMQLPTEEPYSGFHVVRNLHTVHFTMLGGLQPLDYQQLSFRWLVPSTSIALIDTSVKHIFYSVLDSRCADDESSVLPPSWRLRAFVEYNATTDECVCVPGFYDEYAGASVYPLCTPCPPGTYKPDYGSAQSLCLPCGTSNSLNATACAAPAPSPPPAGQCTSLGSAALKDGVTVLFQPWAAGRVAADASAAQSTPVSMFAWSEPQEEDSSHSSSNASAVVLTCRPHDACLAENGALQCGEGFAGPFCDACADGYTALRDGCSACPAAWVSALIIATAVALGLWLVSWVIQRQRYIAGEMAQAEALAMAEGKNMYSPLNTSTSGWNNGAQSQALASVRVYVLALFTVLALADCWEPAASMDLRGILSVVSLSAAFGFGSKFMMCLLPSSMSLGAYVFFGIVCVGTPMLFSLTTPFFFKCCTQSSKRAKAITRAPAAATRPAASVAALALVLYLLFPAMSRVSLHMLHHHDTLSFPPGALTHPRNMSRPGSDYAAEAPDTVPGGGMSHTRVISWTALWSSDAMYTPAAAVAAVFLVLTVFVLPLLVVCWAGRKFHSNTISSKEVIRWGWAMEGLRTSRPVLFYEWLKYIKPTIVVALVTQVSDSASRWFGVLLLLFAFQLINARMPSYREPVAGQIERFLDTLLIMAHASSILLPSTTGINGFLGACLVTFMLFPMFMAVVFWYKRRPDGALKTDLARCGCVCGARPGRCCFLPCPELCCACRSEPLAPLRLCPCHKDSRPGRRAASSARAKTKMNPLANYKRSSRDMRRQVSGNPVQILRDEGYDKSARRLSNSNDRKSMTRGGSGASVRNLRGRRTSTEKRGSSHASFAAAAGSNVAPATAAPAPPQRPTGGANPMWAKRRLSRVGRIMGINMDGQGTPDLTEMQKRLQAFDLTESAEDGAKGQ